MFSSLQASIKSTSIVMIRLLKCDKPRTPNNWLCGLNYDDARSCDMKLVLDAFKEIAAFDKGIC
jgi:hypothetical protein